MNTQDFMNGIYDILAQNPVEQWERDHLTELIDHVDTERNAIVFISPDNGREFELQLVHTFAPSSAVAKENRL